MAEKEKLEKEKGKEQKEEEFIRKLPKEVQEKLKEIKKKIEQFKKKLLEKFEKYIVGIALLPPPRKPEESKEKEEEKINLLVLVDDTDVKKMSPYELKTRIVEIVNKIAEETDKRIKAEVLLLNELWQNCYDGKYELLGLIAMSIPIYDTGMLAAIKIAEVHKSMVLKKFEKYIVSYVLAGSLVQGKATKTSDIDVWVVVDDTDVKRMTRAELKDKLRAIIIGMGIEAGEITGIRNKLNIQVYILTEFWDALKEANPIIFTLLRDGVPFYDRGLFMPWKHMLKMGKIKPSMEAIDMFMSTGEQILGRIKFKIKEIGMEDVFYAILTPSQAALMLYGLPPPTPKETPHLMREIFVKKEKLFEEEYVKILENVIKLRKDLEHGHRQDLSGKELDKYINDAEKYLKRLKRLFSQIEAKKEKENIIHVYETVVTIVRDILKLEGVEKAKSEELIKYFEEELTSKGKIPEKYLRMLDEVLKAKEDYDKGKLTKAEVENVVKRSNELIRFLVEYLQRKRGQELEKARIRVKHGNKYGEVILLDKIAFIIHDIDQEEKEISKADIAEDGSLINIRKSNIEEFEKHIARAKFPKRVFIKEPIFENLKEIFGKDVEVMIHY